MNNSIKNEFVSVIIPVFNRAAFLSRAIKSILNQTHNKFEIIVVDDNSTEKVYDVVDSFRDDRVTFIKNSQNKGVSYSRNIGIKNAKYDLIALLDSDDEWLSDKLEYQIDFFRKNPDKNVVHTEEIWIRNGIRVNPKKHHKKIGGDIFMSSLRLCLMSPSSILIKKSIFDEYGFFDESFVVCEDYDMWLRITLCEEVGFVEKPLIIKYGGHTDQLSRSYPAMDYYRVLSMIKLLNTYNLFSHKKDVVKNMIVEKSKILLNGALKRNKNDDAELYESWIKKYS